MVYPFATGLRLDVEDPSLIPAGQVLSQIKNANGGNFRLTLGGYGWVTPSTGSVGSTILPGTVYVLTFTTAATGAAFFHSEPAPVTPGTPYSAAWSSSSFFSPSQGAWWFRATVQFLDAAGAVIAGSPATGILADSSGAGSLSNLTVPAGAVQARLRFDIYGTSAGANPTSQRTAVFRLIRMGAVSDPSNIIDEPLYTNVLASSSSITIEREALNVGTLTATIPDVAYDPSLNVLLRPGRRIRLIALNTFDTEHAIFTGEVATASVTYDPLNPKPSKRAQINLTATDAITRLANAVRPDGVATIDGLRAVVEGAGVPWRINSQTNQVATPPAITRNESASALDQIVVTRDSFHGYAWLSRNGVLTVNDPANMSATSITLDEQDYGPDLDVSFDDQRCINVVTIKHLRRNLATGETVEVPYGPFRHEASIAEWGPHSAEFTVQGLTDTEAAMKAFADEVFAANAVPQVRVNALTVPIRGRDQISELQIPWELYMLVRVVNANGLDQTVRVTKLTHRISPDGWLLDVGFEAEGGVVAPQQTPPVQNAVDAAPLFASTHLSSPATTSIPNGAITQVTAGWTWTIDSKIVTALGSGSFEFKNSGTYLVNASVTWAINATGRRIVLLYLNGVEVRRNESGPGSGTPEVSHVFTVAAGDVLTVRAYQNSGAALALGASPGHDLQIIRLAPAL